MGAGDGLIDAAEGRWHEHVPQQFQYEWFTNCYQLRCDDDYAWGGCNLHGPYDPDADVDSITTVWTSWHSVFWQGETKLYQLIGTGHPF